MLAVKKSIETGKTQVLILRGFAGHIWSAYVTMLTLFFNTLSPHRMKKMT